MVFIHGFNNRFEDSVYRFAQIVHDSGAHSAPILVTWPSRGSVLAYGYDRESTNYTRNALEDLFQFLARDPDIKEVSILAHSMGNWLALESLRQMAIRNGRLPAKFKNIMLAAPDVDVDVFRSQIADMGKPRPQFTLFVSRDDRALAVSRRVWGDVSRLGSIDPEQAPYKAELADNEITVIDLTKVKAGDKLHHDKFASSPEIVQLIGARMSDGQTLDRQQDRLWRPDHRRDDRRRRRGRQARPASSSRRLSPQSTRTPGPTTATTSARWTARRAARARPARIVSNRMPRPRSVLLLPARIEPADDEQCHGLASCAHVRPRLRSRLRWPSSLGHFCAAAARRNLSGRGNRIQGVFYRRRAVRPKVASAPAQRPGLHQQPRTRRRLAARSVPDSVRSPRASPSSRGAPTRPRVPARRAGRGDLAGSRGGECLPIYLT